MRVTLLLWDGTVGGAERVTVALAGELRRRGTAASILFVGRSGQLVDQLQAEQVPAIELGLPRGAAVLMHPRRLRRAVESQEADVVISISVGYLGAALRAGGYRGPIIGIEHGDLLRIGSGSVLRRVISWLDRLAGVISHDAEVAVSKHMLEVARQYPHAPEVVLIPHGVRAPAPRSGGLPVAGEELIVGYAGRLIPGKGVDRLIGALGRLTRERPDDQIRLRVAGDGELRSSLKSLADREGVGEQVTFSGWVEDVPAHWAGCHVAVAPNDTFEESFCLSAVEAMAAGRPTIVTDLGALPELVTPGETGAIVPAGDTAALSAALAGYRDDRLAVQRQGAAAHERAVAAYSLRVMADAYSALALRLLRRAATHRGPAHRARSADRATLPPAGVANAPRTPSPTSLQAHQSVPVSVVCVTYNSAAVVAEALTAARRVLGDVELIVVDNGSHDDTIDVARAHGADVVVAGHGNVGYGAGVNRGARAANGQLLVVINPDVTLTGADIPALANIATRSVVGLLECRDAERTGDEPQNLHARWSPWVELHWALIGSLLVPRELTLRRPRARSPRAPRWAHGAAFVVSRDEFLSIGGFDEHLFLYFEDVDLSRRYEAHGLPVAGTDAVTHKHTGMASSPRGREAGGHWTLISILEYTATWEGANAAERLARILLRRFDAVSAAARWARPIPWLGGRAVRKGHSAVETRRQLAELDFGPLPDTAYPAARAALSRAASPGHPE